MRAFITLRTRDGIAVVCRASWIETLRPAGGGGYSTSPIPYAIVHFASGQSLNVLESVGDIVALLERKGLEL